MSSVYPQNLNFSPARNIPSPNLIRKTSDVERQYLTDLLAERQKLGPFIQALPVCSRLLDQEILRVSGRFSSHGFSEYNDRLQRGSPSPVPSLDVMPDVGVIKSINNVWNGNGSSITQPERFGGAQGMAIDWQSVPGSPSSFLVKRVMRLDIPADRFPNAQ